MPLRKRDELENLVSLLEIVLPCGDILLLLGTLGSKDALALAGGSRSDDVQLREAGTERFELRFRFFYRDAPRLKLLEVLLGECVHSIYKIYF